MKRWIVFFLVAIPALASAKTYYVSPGGSDRNPGTITQPWKTWGKAFNATGVNPGDTIYFRGGVYIKNLSEGQDTWYYPARSEGGTGYKVGNDGTIGNPIRYWAYPGEIPILDCGNTKAPAGSNYGIRSGSSTYCHFRGLTVRNVWAHNIDNRDVECFAWQLGGTGYKVENCTTYNVHGIGFRIECSWNADFLNCDAYNCCDSINAIGRPGERGTGFGMNNIEYNTTRVTLTNCRAWLCSDQGYSAFDNGLVEYRGCWSFRNGMLGAGGHGFKLGFVREASIQPQRIVSNCIAAFNRQSGFTTNDEGYKAQSMRIYNNTAYHNGYYPEWKSGTGFWIYNSISGDAAELGRIFKNNISYDNEYSPYGVNPGALYTHEYNSWDTPPGVTLTAGDFVSLDSTGITATRQADGSLPNNACYNSFLRIAAGSDLIDAGVNVGLAYNGFAPDLGAFESYYSTISKPITSITISGSGGTSTITTNKGTLQLFASILPSDASYKILTWSVVNGTGKASISSSGLVTAVANGTVTARATANDGSGVYGTLIITISNQVIPISSITVTGAGGIKTITTDNGTLQLSATVSPSNATNKTVTWSVSNGTGQASISSSGLLTAQANGSVTARATANDGSGVYGTLVITISNQVIPVTVISVSGQGGSKIISTDNGTLQLYANITPANATNKSVTWSLNNGTGQATINSSGLVTARENGTVTARATANDGSGIYGTLVVNISNQQNNIANLPPEVHISSPSKGTSFIAPATITFEAFATDPDGTISKVEFFQGNAKLGEITSAPYSFSWKEVPVGKYSITAVATDNLGLSITSTGFELLVEDYFTANAEFINLYPNPNNGRFSIKMLSSFPYEWNSMMVVSLNGETCYQDELNGSIKDFDLSDKPAGIYVMIIKSANTIVATKKFIKK
jgi:uncharacterized protein YjdB